MLRHPLGGTPPRLIELRLGQIALERLAPFCTGRVALGFGNREPGMGFHAIVERPAPCPIELTEARGRADMAEGGGAAQPMNPFGGIHLDTLAFEVEQTQRILRLAASLLGRLAEDRRSARMVTVVEGREACFEVILRNRRKREKERETEDERRSVGECPKIGDDDGDPPSAGLICLRT